jgi:hypothetical protein
MPNAECPNVESNLDKCACTAEECPRRGMCCECLRAHLSSNSLPACVREKAQMVEG